MWLSVRTGQARGTSVNVEGERFVLGRGDECDLTLPDSKVSRRHAVIERRVDGGTTLRDLGSSNGTFLNGERVESAPLSSREQIQLGDTLLTTSAERPPASRDATVVGSRIRSRTDSALQRLVLQRSVRRATLLAGAAAAVAVVLAALVATGATGGRSNAAIERVVDAAAPATVLVEARRDGRRTDAGTGWVLDAREGLVVTNAHVVNGGERFRLGVANSFRAASVVGVAPCEDLALLRVADASHLRELPLADEHAVRQGETVVAVGYPGNASLEDSLASTTGVVSVARTRYREAALDVPRYPSVVQTDTAINPGNSGGPLLDLEGRVVGVISAGRTVSPDGRIIQGQGYAIAADRTRQVTDALRSGRSLAWTGLSFDYLPARELARRRLPVGLLVAGAVPGTPAARAGLARGGLVLLAVNGVRVGNSLASYCDAAVGLGHGDRVALKLFDPRTTKRRTVVLPAP